MPSSLKSLFHVILSVIGMWIPGLITGNPYVSVPLAGVIMYLFNLALSYTIPTTTGRSAEQNL